MNALWVFVIVCIVWLTIVVYQHLPPTPQSFSAEEVMAARDSGARMLAGMPYLQTNTPYVLRSTENGCEINLGADNANLFVQSTDLGIEPQSHSGLPGIPGGQALMANTKYTWICNLENDSSGDSYLYLKGNHVASGLMEQPVNNGPPLYSAPKKPLGKLDKIWGVFDFTLKYDNDLSYDGPLKSGQKVSVYYGDDNPLGLELKIISPGAATLCNVDFEVVKSPWLSLVAGQKLTKCKFSNFQFPRLIKFLSARDPSDITPRTIGTTDLVYIVPASGGIPPNKCGVAPPPMMAMLGGDTIQTSLSVALGLTNNQWMFGGESRQAFIVGGNGFINDFTLVNYTSGQPQPFFTSSVQWKSWLYGSPTDPASKREDYFVIDSAIPAEDAYPALSASTSCRSAIVTGVQGDGKTACEEYCNSKEGALYKELGERCQLEGGGACVLARDPATHQPVPCKAVYGKPVECDCAMVTNKKFT